MIRLTERTEQTLRQLAEETGRSAEMVLEEALDAYRREHFFAAVDAAYRALWADPAARAEELAERALLEGTLADGLDEG